MEGVILFNLIFLGVVNVFFAFFGTFSNLVVVLSIWKCSPLRKKTCFFMIFVLSCFDIVVILVNHPLVITLSILFVLGEIDKDRIDVCLGWTHLLMAFSSLTLLTMNIDRYLATTHPVFHRNSVTRPKLVTLLLSFQLFALATKILSVLEVAVSPRYCYIIILVIFSPPMIFTNIKMFVIARRMRQNGVIPKTGVKKNRIDLKKNSTCLLAVACFLLLSVFPGVIFTSLMPIWTVDLTEERILFLWLWIRTIICTNSTFNCYIFFWNNKILRDKGKKLIDTYLCFKL